MTGTVPLAYHPEYAAYLATLPVPDEPVPLPPVGDVEGRRESFTGLLGTGEEPFSDSAVTVTDHTYVSYDGTEISGRLFTPTDRSSDAFGVFTHGGGMILGTMGQYTPKIARYAIESGTPLFAPDYRLAPEFPNPTPVEDCYAGIVWAWENIEQLGGCDSDRFFIIGDSAGGNLAAAGALMARDRSGPPLAAQILIYPMLDDRTTVADPTIVDALTWTYEDNMTGWSALLGEAAGAEMALSPYATPGRAENVAGLPPTYIDVGTLDIFRDEDVAYATRLLRAGVQTELHVYPGVPHAFDLIGPDLQVTKGAFANRVRAIRAV